MRDNFLIVLFACPLLILLFLITQVKAIVPKELTIEDCLPWTDEEIDPANEVARFDKRMFHFTMDSIVFFLLQIACYKLLSLAGYSSSVFITVFLWFLYYPVMEYKTGKTLAKYFTRTHVVSYDLSVIESDQALKRNLLRLIPFELFSFFETYPTGWHDSLSDTLVINDPAPVHIVQWVDESE